VKPFARLTLDRLTILDERAFLRLPLYRALKSIVLRSNYAFRVSRTPNWDRALLLNLTYWSAEAQGDVLPARRLHADVVTHVAWHHLAQRTLDDRSARAMFLGESVASAFDVYLIGHLLQRGRRSSFLETQMAAFAQAAKNSGTSARSFEALVAFIASRPEAAFAELRALLMDATCALYESDDADVAANALARFDEERFACVLHHYELSTWVLHAKAHQRGKTKSRTRTTDAALRSPLAIDWLTHQWIAPALG
jgi:hypothetical protein